MRFIDIVIKFQSKEADMRKIRAILKVFFLLSVVHLVAVRGDCEIHFQQNAPLIVQRFGSRKIIQSDPKALSLNDGEEIEAYCSGELIARTGCCNTLSKKYEQIRINSEVFQCISNQLHYEDYEYSGSYSGIILSCSDKSIKLYESNSSLPNCAYMSYGIGMDSIEETTKKTGLCFDLDTLSIKYAKYLTYRINNNVITTKNAFKENDVISLDMELKRLSSLFSFLGEDLFMQNYRSKQVANTLLNDQNFVYESLIDDNGFFNYKDRSFEDMFKIIWWKNLREGNWNFFMNALKERSDNVTYMAYTGVSGTVDVPSMKSCNKTEKLEIRTNELTVKAPANIYTYLQSLDENVMDEFVVIAYNTPFYAIDKKDELCDDICHEIDWLNRSIFGRTHIMPAFGFMTCCRVEDVFNKLENFPYLKQNMVEGTTQSPIKTS